MGLINSENVRLIAFADRDLPDNLGVLVNGHEFIDITATLPEFPEKLHDILALENAAALLADALYYEKGGCKISGLSFKAPLCKERNLWIYTERNRHKGVYMHNLRGMAGHRVVLRPPAGRELNMVPHIVFAAGGFLRNAALHNVLNQLKAFTLLNLGVITTSHEHGGPEWRGLASQYEGVSSAGPWLMLCDNPQGFLDAKTLDVFRNGEHLALVKLGGLLRQAAEVFCALAETFTVAPGDMLALPVLEPFRVVAGDRVELRLDGFGELSNIIGAL